MANRIYIGNQNEEIVYQTLKKELNGSAISIKLVHDEIRNLYDKKVYFLVYDQYYNRANSRVSLSVLISDQNGSCKVSCVGSGGGKGVFIDFSWFSEDSFILKCEKILFELGFRESQ
jgi:HKD family nuclease